MIAEVIVDIASGETDRIFDYLCDDDVVVGSRVRAPFGNKLLSGFVMRIKESSDYPKEKLKKATPIGDELPALTSECLALSGKIANRYRVPKALALRLFLPTEMRTGKVRERYKNYASLTLPFAQIPFSKTAKNQRGAAEYLAANGKTECALLNAKFPGGVSALQKKGYVQIERVQTLRNPYQTLDRETELECCSQSFLACHMHFTLMALDKLVGLQQADTRSGDAEIDGIVSTEQAFEKLFLIVA